MSRPKSAFVPLSSPQLRKQSLREQAVNVIKQHIVEAHLPPGAKLPPERDLSQGLAVSRTVVREALAALEAGGWIEHRPSTGYFVTPKASTAPANPAEQVRHLLHETLEVRLAIEVGVAEVLVQRVTDGQLDELEHKALALDEAMMQHEAHAEAELLFHLSVWATAHNQFLLALGRQILGDYFRALALARPDTFYRPAQDATAQRHLPIVKALRTRDLTAVQAAFRDHCQLPQAMLAQVQDGDERIPAIPAKTNGASGAKGKVKE